MPTDNSRSVHHPTHRYFNPPSAVPQLGRKLIAGGFPELMAQLRPREVLIALGNPQNTHEAAGHVTDKARLEEFDREWVSSIQYFAVDVGKIGDGFTPPIPPEELARL